MSTWQPGGSAGSDHGPLMPIRGGVSGRVVFGLVMLALGLLWTLDNLGFLESDRIVQWWPAVIVAIGVAKLLGLGTHRNLAWGGVFTAVGMLLLLDSIDVANIDGGLIVSVVLVAVGASLVFRRRPTTVAGAAGGSSDPSATLDTFAMWSGNVHKSVSSAFRGGEASAVMGGVELDLRPARLAPEGAVIELFTWWGGIDIRVAPNTRVINQATVFMGGIDDKSHPGDGSGGTLVLRGLIVMGGVDIKN